ncbi:uncharacterized protein LOC142329963 isoform X2 [Lycorma delicatula]|uniref:uncharacterized protein LOC142329963 isoform X2 n=1 Tax=Lycorma delicatula TaxID=130591 RepID=UPI003F514F82
MAATTSMQQHFGLQQTPLRTLNRGNHFLRTSRNAVSVKRKSAVELLQETKSLYVKSETVLDRKQELKSSTCHYLPLSSQPCGGGGGGRYKENKAGSLDGRDIQMPMPPPKSPRLVNISQRRSTTPAPSCSDQLQTKLRRLLNADSKENLLDDGIHTQENVQFPIRSYSRCSSHAGEKIILDQNRCPVHHKSLPDLHTSISSSSENSDHSDPPSYEYTTYNTSEKSVSKSKSGDAMSLASSHSRQLSISSSSEGSESDSFSSDGQSTGEHSSAFMVVGSPVKSSASYGGSTSGTDYRYNESDWRTSGKAVETYNWRPILRSKSDVGRRYARLSTHADPPSPSTPPDLETFFEQLGLDSADYSVLIRDESRSPSSSPVFFSDTSTVDSATLCTTIGSQSIDTDHTPSSNDLPSIVERNARIIKWLCNCRKAQSFQTTQRHTTLS